MNFKEVVCSYGTSYGLVLYFKKEVVISLRFKMNNFILMFLWVMTRDTFGGLLVCTVSHCGRTNTMANIAGSESYG